MSERQARGSVRREDGVRNESLPLHNKYNKFSGMIAVATRFIAFVLVALSLSFSGLAQNSGYTPKPNSAERKLILDALRALVESELKKPVLFKVDHLKALGEWAFMRGVPLRPDGKRMDYKATPYEEAIKEGVFDDWICALLRKEKGKWRVVIYSIGATDVAYEGWDEEYKAPKEIFR